MNKQDKTARIDADITMTEQLLQQAIERNDEAEIARQNAWLAFNRSQLAILNGDIAAAARFNAQNVEYRATEAELRGWVNTIELGRFVQAFYSAKDVYFNQSKSREQLQVLIDSCKAAIDFFELNKERVENPDLQTDAILSHWRQEYNEYKELFNAGK